MRTLMPSRTKFTSEFTKREPHSWDPRQRTSCDVATSDFNSVLRKEWKCRNRYLLVDAGDVEKDGEVGEMATGAPGLGAVALLLDHRTTTGRPRTCRALRPEEREHNEERILL